MDENGENLWKWDNWLKMGKIDENGKNEYLLNCPLQCIAMACWRTGRIGNILCGNLWPMGTKDEAKRP